MSDIICNSCKKKPEGCNRTVGKRDGKYVCYDYDPVIECSTCKRDGTQLVERKCLHCTDEFKNWSLKI